MSNLEIERKFLVATLPPGFLNQYQGEDIEQGYLMREGETELRIRKRGGRCTMTLKQGCGLERREQEQDIDGDLFAMLWPLTAGKRIEKTRYLIHQQGFCLELDVFSGVLAPLVLLEVEFDSIEESRHFSPPGFVIREVTDNKAYSNAMLATVGIPAETHH